MASPRTIADVTAALRAEGFPMELVKGAGYLYFVWDEPALNIWETKSVYVAAFNHQAPAEWVNDGRVFAREVMEMHALRRSENNKPAADSAVA